MPYDPSTDVGYLRLLVSDVDDTQPVFDDAEYAAFIDREGSVKLAAVRVLLTIAGNELLLAKAMRSQDVETDGAKVSAELRALAATYKAEADAEATDSQWAFELEPYNATCVVPELTEYPYGWPCQ